MFLIQLLRNTTSDLGIKTDVSLQLGSVKSQLTLDKMPRTQAESMLIWCQNENKINKPDIKLQLLGKSEPEYGRSFKTSKSSLRVPTLGSVFMPSRLANFCINGNYVYTH